MCRPSCKWRWLASITSSGLRSELGLAQQKLAERKFVERAKGLLMKALQLERRRGVSHAPAHGDGAQPTHGRCGQVGDRDGRAAELIWCRPCRRLHQQRRVRLITSFTRLLTSSRRWLGTPKWMAASWLLRPMKANSRLRHSGMPEPVLKYRVLAAHYVHGRIGLVQPRLFLRAPRSAETTFGVSMKP